MDGCTGPVWHSCCFGGVRERPSLNKWSPSMAEEETALLGDWITNTRTDRLLARGGMENRKLFLSGLSHWTP